MGKRKRRKSSKNLEEPNPGGSSNTPPSGSDVVESFRPQRDDTIATDEQTEVDQPEDESLIHSNLQQTQKLPPSAYTLLEDQDAIADLTAVSSTHLDNEMDDDSTHGSDTKFSRVARATAKKRRAHPQWHRLKKYVYNRDTDTYCNRSIGSWCAVCNYYAWVILTFLGIFMLFILTFEWRDTRYSNPVIMKINVMPDPNPALSLVPRANHSEMLIWFKNDKMAENYINSIGSFIERQELLCNQSKLLKHVCHFDVKAFGPCAHHDYGYNSKQPCIFLKINNLLTWIPAAFPKDHDFPLSVSNDLVEQIEQEAPRHCIYVDCKGATNHDKAHLGRISYYPEQAFDIKYFPATVEMKTNPVIAIKLKEIDPGYMLNIKCTMLAANIKNQRNSVIKFAVYIK